MKRSFILILFALLLLPALSLAAPTADAVKSVLDHYNSGVEVILVDFQFCSAIAREGEQKNACVDTLDPATLHKDDKVYLWMNFLVPKETTPKVLIRFNIAGRTMKTRNLILSGSFRYRTWALLPTDKAGTWTIAIDQENGTDFSPISSLNYQVNAQTE